MEDRFRPRAKDARRMAGMIFICNKQTMAECFHHGLFGLPSNLWWIVKQIVPGTVLFLFEYEARQMWGIFEATSHGCVNIKPSIFSCGEFPAQVRFKELKCCRPLCESEFRSAIRDNYFTPTKFYHQLSYDQVYKLHREFILKTNSPRENILQDKINTLRDEGYDPVDYSIDPEFAAKQAKTKNAKECDPDDDAHTLYADRMEKPSVWSRLSVTTTKSDKRNHNIGVGKRPLIKKKRFGDQCYSENNYKKSRYYTTSDVFHKDNISKACGNQCVVSENSTSTVHCSDALDTSSGVIEPTSEFTEKDLLVLLRDSFQESHKEASQFAEMDMESIVRLELTMVPGYKVRPKSPPKFREQLIEPTGNMEGKPGLDLSLMTGGFN